MRMTDIDCESLHQSDKLYDQTSAKRVKSVPWEDFVHRHRHIMCALLPSFIVFLALPPLYVGWTDSPYMNEIVRYDKHIFTPNQLHVIKIDSSLFSASEKGLICQGIHLIKRTFIIDTDTIFSGPRKKPGDNHSDFFLPLPALLLRERRRRRTGGCNRPPSYMPTARAIG